MNEQHSVKVNESMLAAETPRATVTIEIPIGSLVYAREAMRRRRRELERSIGRALSSRAAGGTIQYGTLESHQKEHAEMVALERLFEAGRIEYAQRIGRLLKRGGLDVAP